MLITPIHWHHCIVGQWHHCIVPFLPKLILSSWQLKVNWGSTSPLWNYVYMCTFSAPRDCCSRDWFQRTSDLALSCCHPSLFNFAHTAGAGEEDVFVNRANTYHGRELSSTWKSCLSTPYSRQSFGANFLHKKNVNRYKKKCRHFLVDQKWQISGMVIIVERHMRLGPWWSKHVVQKNKILREKFCLFV